MKLSLPFQNLTSLEDYDILVDQVPMWERKLSSLLGDMNIKYNEDSPSVSVVEYLNYLYRVVSLLKKGLLGADASTTIQPGEFKVCTARILRFVSFCVTRSLREKLKSFCAQIVSGERDYKFEQGSDYWQLIHFQQTWNMSNNSSISIKNLSIWVDNEKGMPGKPYHGPVTGISWKKGYVTLFESSLEPDKTTVLSA